MSDAPRRIVTGHDAGGKAIFASDGPPPVTLKDPARPGIAFYEIWNTAQSPARIDVDGKDPTVGRPIDVAPPKTGTIIRMVDFPPGDGRTKMSDAEAKQLFATMGLDQATSGHSSDRHPLMHRTETIDYGIVLWGEITLVLDEDEVHLKAGDVVVQRGTIHAWSNRGEQPCRMAFILIDGAYAEPLAGHFDGGQHS
jgi:naringenin degradation protein FdeH